MDAYTMFTIKDSKHMIKASGAKGETRTLTPRGAGT